MTQNNAAINNFSPLPFYGNLADQNAKKWFVGGVFPFYGTVDKLLPFQLMRPHRESPDYQEVSVYNTETNVDIDSNGDIQSGGSSTVNKYLYSEIGDSFYIYNLPENSVDASDPSIVFYDSSNNVVLMGSKSSFLGGGDSGLIDTQEYGITFYSVAILVETPDESGCKVCYQQATGTVPTDFTEAVLIDANTDEVVRDITTSIVSGGGWNTENGSFDVFCFNCKNSTDVAQSPGRYYIRLTDGTDTWYSDIVTLIKSVSDESDFITVEWGFSEDLDMDAGRIAATYERGGLTETFSFKAIIPGSIAKPQYLYEDEGEDRDGYFFATKQISKKRYRFTFFACEYLLDALRFVRLADSITIYNHGRTFDVTSFEIEPTWEAEGDVASVECLFDTDTAVKVIC